ncbi:phosphate regulon sensor histidine kinase PhoR [Inhella sp.]|uniref:phosphate regulon sensor histidine kinase PhoR n=1 Tax=Inhella sp. TaxID=1921806 RepID=UPI0035B12871
MQDWPLWLALAVIGALGYLWLREGWRTNKLLRWMVRDGEGPAPIVQGPLAELAYRFEKALRKREATRAEERGRLQHLLTALEAYPNGLLLLDANDQIQWLNHIAADQLGLLVERDLQQNIRNLLRAPAFVELMQREEGGTVVISRHPLQLQLTLRRFGDGRGPAALLLVQDVTERMRLEQMRSDFVANVSHEIRSPLTVLTGYLETLQTLPLSDAERQRSLQQMRQQADRMQLLVSDLLTLATLEGAPKPPPDTWVSLHALLQRCHADGQGADQGRHVLSLENCEPELHLSGNEGEWWSAVANLVGNALRYTPEGGTVHMAWRWLEDGRGEFAVLDTGPGIPAEHLPRLTERFYRVDSSRSRATGGTGLGLAIVKHVLQRHGAELVIESQLGQGSQFRIRIPKHRLRHEGVMAAA